MYKEVKMAENNSNFAVKKLSEKSTFGGLLTTVIAGAGLYFGLTPEISLSLAAGITTLIPEK